MRRTGWNRRDNRIDWQLENAMRLLLASILLSCLAGTALADDAPRRDAEATLPGVEGKYSIVAPAPEPLEEPRAGDGTTFRAGNWDVTISGHVSVQVGNSTRPDAR